MSAGITTLLTIVTGVVIVVLGHGFVKLFLEPLQEFRKELNQVKADLLIYEGVFKAETPSAIAQQKARGALRRHAALVLARADGIPFYAFFAALGVVPKYGRVITTHHHLRELAQHLGDGHTREQLEKDLR